MAKLTEKMLYQTFLDLYYADGLYDDTVSDLSDQLKEVKKQSKKTKKLLTKAKEHYKKIYGEEPSIKK